MNILLFDERDLDAPNSNQIVLRDQRASHVRDVLKSQPGHQLRVGKIDGTAGVAVVLATTTSEIRLEILHLSEEPPAPSPIELILALPRPKSLKRTLRAIANLGIKSIHLIHSARVEKSYWSAPVLESEMMRATLLEGLSIARDTRMPTVRLHRLFKPFAQDIAPHLVADEAFVAHPSADPATLSAPPASVYDRVPLAIGPEGGFTDYEVGLFHEAGYKTLSLGPRIYSVECALPVLEATLRARRLPTR